MILNTPIRSWLKYINLLSKTSDSDLCYVAMTVHENQFKILISDKAISTICDLPPQSLPLRTLRIGVLSGTN